jgi:alanyl-tRNA synthetase
VFPGDTAFKLYDTYGFPLDLTQDALRSRGVTVDTGAFSRAMDVQKNEARKAWKGSGDAQTETVWFDIREQSGATEFLGYETEKAEGVISAIVQSGKKLDILKAGDTAQLVFNQTPFYGESGGQSGDLGVVQSASGARFVVTSTEKRVGDVFVHAGKLETGSLAVGEAVELIVDHARRSGNRQHHSATHLLHEALRKTLGGHVQQKGSLVEPERLRFDFSHTKAMSHDELRDVEEMANAIVQQNDAVQTRLMTVDAAVAEGAMALFGEKYGDEVRVVSMGRNPDGSSRPIYSLELCGGTHVNRTGDIGVIKVVSESGSAAGVRRLEALAGNAARAYLEQQDRRVQAAAAALKTSPAELVPRIEALLEDRRKLERELTEAKRALAKGGGAGPVTQDVSVNGKAFRPMIVSDLDANSAKGLVDDMKASLGSGIVAIISKSAEGKVGLYVGVTNDLTRSNNAVDLVRVGSIVLGGKGGGGRPDLAQAGGPDASKAEAALEAIKAAIK